MRHEGKFYQSQGGEESDGQTDRGLPWRNRAAVFTECQAMPSNATTPNKDCN